LIALFPNLKGLELNPLNLVSKNVKLAHHAGFCYGVKRAVDLSIKIKEENPDTPVYILGQLIHNNQVIEHLNSLGIQTIENIPDELNGICIIRTHGVTPQTIQLLQEKGCRIVDATCPDVKRVQDKARALAEEGYKVIIIGKADHPEVIAIKAHADLCSDNEAIVISSVEEVDNYINILRKERKVGIVIQTTQTTENFKKILPVVAEYASELKIYNTICSATFKRQKETLDLAKEVDLMIVVGSKSSANTTHLAELAGQIQTTIHIETSEELDQYKDLINKTSKIGITAGASTPGFIIDKVIERIGE
jgi:(E)-4-hydroxy-3-methyl-but-2-enyl pyrophosphate reductase